MVLGESLPSTYLHACCPPSHSSTVNMRTQLLVVALLAIVLGTMGAKKAEDPKECEVCVEVMEGVEAIIPADEKKSKTSIEEAVDKYCKNKELSAKQKKMCYYIEPIKKSVSQPFSLRLPKKKVRVDGPCCIVSACGGPACSCPPACLPIAPGEAVLLPVAVANLSAPPAPGVIPRAHHASTLWSPSTPGLPAAEERQPRDM